MMGDRLLSHSHLHASSGGPERLVIGSLVQQGEGQLPVQLPDLTFDQHQHPISS